MLIQQSYRPCCPPNLFCGVQRIPPSVAFQRHWSDAPVLYLSNIFYSRRVRRRGQKAIPRGNVALAIPAHAMPLNISMLIANGTFTITHRLRYAKENNRRNSAGIIFTYPNLLLFVDPGVKHLNYLSTSSPSSPCILDRLIDLDNRVLLSQCPLLDQLHRPRDLLPLSSTRLIANTIPHDPQPLLLVVPLSTRHFALSPSAASLPVRKEEQSIIDDIF